MKKYGQPRKIVTDGLRAYSAAMKAIGNSDRQEVGRGRNNRAENSHQPFRCVSACKIDPLRGVIGVQN